MTSEKYVDESWKESVEKEKEKYQKSKPNDPGWVSSSEQRQSSKAASSAPQEPITDDNFLTYLTSLGYQAMIFLGETPNPVTRKTEKKFGAG